MKLRMLIGTAVLAAATSFPATAQQLKGDVRFYNAFPPGGTSDLLGRMLADALSPVVGHKVIVEQKTGASGFIAAEATARSAPDGHTLFLAPMALMTISPQMPGQKVPIDVDKELTPISNVAGVYNILVANPNGPFKTVPELIDYAKKNPGKLEFGSTGNGSYFHLAGEALKHAAGIDLLHVPYSQANYPQLQTDFLNGRIALFATTWFNVGPNLQRLKALAIIDRQRSKRSPNVAIVTDYLPNFEPFVVWWGLLAPVGLPPPIANRVAAESRKALLQPDVTPKLDDLGMEVVGNTPEEFAVMLRNDINAIGKLVKAIGLQPE